MLGSTHEKCVFSVAVSDSRERCELVAPPNSGGFRSRGGDRHAMPRRSLGAVERAGRVFHPVPSHRGQTSTCVLVNIKFRFQSFTELYSLTLHPDPIFPQVRITDSLCTTCAGLCGAVEA